MLVEGKESGIYIQLPWKVKRSSPLHWRQSSVGWGLLSQPPVCLLPTPAAPPLSQ